MNNPMTMKTVPARLALSLFICVCLICATPEVATAQRGYSAGTYYQQRYQVADQPIGQVYPKYGWYGELIGYFQVWQQARWYSDRGGQYIYVWTNYGWQAQWYEGTYWWYDWVDYERRIR